MTIFTLANKKLYIPSASSHKDIAAILLIALNKLLKYFYTPADISDNKGNT
jgi:hypothetical protein